MSICHEVCLAIEPEVVEIWTHLAILLDQVFIPSGLTDRCQLLEPPHTVGLQPICWTGNEESETRRIFHAAIDRQFYTMAAMEASAIDFICAITPTSNGMCLEMHELLYRQLETLQQELRNVQEHFRYVIIEEDEHQPRSSKLPRTSDTFLYARHVRSAETCERAMSKYYCCHPKFQFDAHFSVLRLQMKELIDWALRSPDGGFCEDDHPEDYCYPMSKICQLQPQIRNTMGTGYVNEDPVHSSGVLIC